MKIFSTTPLAVAGLASALLISGCALSPAKTSDWPEMKEISRVWQGSKQGVLEQASRVAMVKPGQSREGVRQLLGFPHFEPGFSTGNQWNYAFKTDIRPNDVCQFRVVFDKDAKVANIQWKDAACDPANVRPPAPQVVERIVERVVEREVVRPAPVIAVAPVAAPTPASVMQAINHPAVAYFAYSKSGKGDLLAPSTATLDKLIAEMRSMKSIRNVEIIGHADRTARAEGNQRLSIERAETVKAYMVERGLNPVIVTTRGVSSNEPIVGCNAGTGNSLANCLTPNRRVDVLVTGTR